MKKILLLLGICLHLLANDVLVFNNEFQVLPLQKKIKRLIVGNKKIINVSLLNASATKGTLLKIFGKKAGNTSILLVYRDNTIENYHVYVNDNLGYIQKMINIIEPNLTLSKVGNGSTVIAGVFKDPHDKKRIYEILQKGGINIAKLMDLTKTRKVNKMIRTKLYLVAIDNQKAKDLGGVTGLNFFSQYINAAVNPTAVNAVTFSGFLLNNLGKFSQQTGHSTLGTLNFLQKKGIASILDDTVLITTEDKNATFRVGGELFIPTGITQNVGTAPTIQVSSHEYGLKLTLTTKFMQKDGYMHINVHIKDSAIDPDKSHNVSLGQGISIPSFIGKSIKTNVVVKSKQVIALGGRLHSENSRTEEKVPFLGDIPLLGELFKHKIKNLYTKDLIFLLVPEIVDANENIDDANFYEEFKKSSNLLHAKIIKVKEKKKKVVAQEKQIEDINVSEALPIIESETDTEAVTEPSSIKQPQEISIAVAEPTNIKQAPVPAPIKIKKYTVNAQKIFLRNKPVNGKRVNVWKKGHKFTANESKVIDGFTWLKVKQDCFSTCKDVNNNLWISQRYTK